MAEAKVAPRPLSPHLQVYRWSWTMAMSVAHRITGTALYGGIALLAIWLVALASGPSAFDAVQWFFGTPIGYLILFGYTWILMHHMLGGVRHMIWDTGRGFDLATVDKLCWGSLIASVSLTILVWIVAFLF